MDHVIEHVSIAKLHRMRRTMMHETHEQARLVRELAYQVGMSGSKQHWVQRYDAAAARLDKYCSWVDAIERRLAKVGQ